MTILNIAVFWAFAYAYWVHDSQFCLVNIKTRRVDTRLQDSNRQSNSTWRETLVYRNYRRRVEPFPLLRASSSSEPQT